MGKSLTTWKPGQTGNVLGRPPGRGRPLAEMLKLALEDTVVVGNEEMPGKVALVLMVREFALHGEVWANGRRIAADTAADWFGVVRWIFEHVDGKAPTIPEVEPEMVVHVVYDDEN